MFIDLNCFSQVSDVAHWPLVSLHFPFFNLFPFFWSQTFSNYLLKPLFIIPSRGIYRNHCLSVCLSVSLSVCPSVCIDLCSAHNFFVASSKARNAIDLHLVIVRLWKFYPTAGVRLWMLPPKPMLLAMAYDYLLSLLYNFSLNREVNKKWMIYIK